MRFLWLPRRDSNPNSDLRRVVLYPVELRGNVKCGVLLRLSYTAGRPSPELNRGLPLLFGERSKQLKPVWWTDRDSNPDLRVASAAFCH